MKIALLGSTGLVGKNVVQLLAQLDEVACVCCPVRSLPDLGAMGVLQGSSKFVFESVDFDALFEALRKHGYNDTLAIEFVPTQNMDLKEDMKRVYDMFASRL